MSLKTLTEHWAKEIGNAFYMSISDVFEVDVGKSYVDTAPSRLAGLRLRTGGLLRSYRPQSKQGLFSYTASDKGLQVVVGSRMPYANIHETGGTIFAKRTTPTKRGAFWSMSLYFLHRFRETQSEYYRNLFLAVKKKGFVKIPRRQYFSKAAKDFQRNKYPRLLGIFLQQLLREWANRELFSETE